MQFFNNIENIVERMEFLMADTITNQNGGTNPQENTPKTYSQEEYDAQLATGRNEVCEAFGVTAENASSEIEAFKAWKAEQTKVTKPNTENNSGDELGEVKNQVTALTRQLTVVKAGIPSEKAERYVKLATSYMNDKTDFDAALQLALADFPLVTKAESSKQFGGSVSGGKTDKLPDEEKIKKIFERMN